MSDVIQVGGETLDPGVAGVHHEHVVPAVDGNAARLHEALKLGQ